MKILIVTEYYPPKSFGGGEISCKILAKALAKEGNDVTVLTSFSPDLNLVEDDGMKNYRVLRLLKTGESSKGIRNNIKRVFTFNKTVKERVKELDKENNYDVIHCYNLTSTVGVAQANLNKKLVATINAYIHVCPKGNMLYKKIDDGNICEGCCSFTKFISCIKESEYVGKQKLTPITKLILILPLYYLYCMRKKSLKQFNLLGRSKYVAELLKKHKLTEKKIGIEYPMIDENE